MRQRMRNWSMTESGTVDPVKRPGRRYQMSQRVHTAIEVVAFATAVFFLGWGADALARTGAEALLARNIQNATGVSEPPVVNVQGFAFVPQVVRGSYNEVNVTTRGLTSGPLRVDRVIPSCSTSGCPFMTCWFKTFDGSASAGRSKTSLCVTRT